MRSAVLVIAALLVCAPISANAQLFGRKKSTTTKGEYIIVSGGPALRQWENLMERPHDFWWGNFIRAARFRMTALIRKNPDINLTWFVYRPAYVSRGKEDGRSRIADIESVPAMFARDYKHPIRLSWFDETEELIAHVNNRDGTKVIGFEYFGHSNRHAFMFDYSNHVSGASRAWLHESELRRFRRRAFDRNGFFKSWGCHSGQKNSFCKAFRKATGVGMWGATDKTDYSVLKDDRMPVVLGGGKWVRP